MNEYEIALFVGGCISIFCVTIYIFSWIAQWVWAWVDDDEIKELNWVSSKVNFSKWKYPVYNNYGKGLEKDIKNKAAPFGYAKDKKLANSAVSNLIEGVDYKYSHNVYGGFWSLIFGLSLTPLIALCLFKVYPLTICALVLLLVLYLARFARRNKKMFDEHAKDKNAHKV